MTRDLWSETNEPEFVERKPPFGLTPRAWVRLQLLVVVLFLVVGVSFVFWVFADRDGDIELELGGEPFDDVLRIESQALLRCDSDVPASSDELRNATIDETHFRVLSTGIGISLSPCSSIEVCEAATFQRAMVPISLDSVTQQPSVPEDFSLWFEPRMELRREGEVLVAQGARRFEIDGACRSIGRVMTLRSIEAGERYELDEEVRFGSCETEQRGDVPGTCELRRRSVLVADGNL